MLKLFFYVKSNKFVQVTWHSNLFLVCAKYVRLSPLAQGAQFWPRRGIFCARGHSLVVLSSLGTDRWLIYSKGCSLCVGILPAPAVKPCLCCKRVPHLHAHAFENKAGRLPPAAGAVMMRQERTPDMSAVDIWLIPAEMWGGCIRIGTDKTTARSNSGG